MKDPKTSVKEFSISQYPRPQNKLESGRLGYSDGEFMGYSLRNGQYRYTMWLKDTFRTRKTYSNDLVVATELYDYVKDPNETVNVVNDPGYVLVAKELNSKLIEFFRSQQKKLNNK